MAEHDGWQDLCPFERRCVKLALDAVPRRRRCWVSPILTATITMTSCGETKPDSPCQPSGNPDTTRVIGDRSGVETLSYDPDNFSIIGCLSQILALL